MPLEHCALKYAPEAYLTSNIIPDYLYSKGRLLGHNLGPQSHRC